MPRYRVVDGSVARADGSVAGVGDHVELDADVAALHARLLRLDEPMLLGSDVLPATFHLPGDKLLTLGDVVRAAHDASGLTVEAWNALESAQREKLLDDALIKLLEAEKGPLAVGS